MPKSIVPKWIKDRLIGSADKDRRSMFLSDSSRFSENLQAQLDQILGDLNQALPIAQESFFAQTAGQGLQGGEVASQFYRNVVTPLHRGAQQRMNVAATGSAIDLERLQSQQRIAAEQLDMDALNELVMAIMADEQAKNASGAFERMMEGLMEGGGIAIGTALAGG